MITYEIYGEAVYRCYVQREKGLYVAACIDICAAAQHDKLIGAMGSLCEMVLDLEGDALKDEYFNPPKAPLSLRVKYWVGRILGQ